MNVIAWILGIILAATFAVSGATKVVDLDRMREHFGYSRGRYRLIGLSEIAGAAGVMVGVAWTKVEWIGVGAAIGLCTLLVGALMTHARVEDEGKKIVPAILMFALTGIFMIVISLR